MISSKLRAYSAAVFIAALVLSMYLVRTNPVDDWLPVLALAALNVVVENFAFALPVSGSVSLAFAFSFAALLHSGPLAAVVCAIAGSTNLQEFREGKPLVLRMFNVGQLALSAGLAGLTYRGLGGQFVAGGGWGIASPPLAALAAAVVFFCVNVLLVGYGASLLTGQSFFTTIRGQGFVSYGASLVVLALLGLIVANLLALRSWIGLLLLVLPFMAARRTFRVYAELSEAYTSTVRSLVAAVEAKDPYTHGHSERVAVYARRLAEAMGVSRSEVELLERAALLHDVGKIGIDLDTLTSPVQLASEEVREIRRHPLLGSQLVSDVEFLSDIVPIVRHHHERVDGAGYPDGLVGDRIPALARMLAVADSYDAMTSNRAYRSGMSEEQALAELTRVAGTQLDEAFTRRFVSMMRESGGVLA